MKYPRDSALEFKPDRDKLESEDLVDVAEIIRIHVEIRNRSFMRRVHRDCFLGSDAVDFMVAYSKCILVLSLRRIHDTVKM